MTTTNEPQNRPMTDEETAEMLGASGGFVFDTAKFRSRLFVCEPLDGEDNWYLYGDLRPAFGVGDGFAPADDDDDGAFGNHEVAKILEESPVVDLDSIDLDPEGATFFAYAETRSRIEQLARDISDAVGLRREQTTLEGKVAEAIAQAIEDAGELVPAGLPEAARRAIKVVADVLREGAPHHDHPVWERAADHIEGLS